MNQRRFACYVSRSFHFCDVSPESHFPYQCTVHSTQIQNSRFDEIWYLSLSLKYLLLFLRINIPQLLGCMCYTCGSVPTFSVQGVFVSLQWMDGKSYSGQIAQVSTISGPWGATLMEPKCLWTEKSRNTYFPAFWFLMFGQEKGTF